MSEKSENPIHRIINVRDELAKPATLPPPTITEHNDPVYQKGLITALSGEKVLLGSEEANAALKGLTTVYKVAPASTPELTSEERRELLANEKHAPTSGLLQVRGETDEGTTAAPAEQKPIDQK